MSSPTEVKPTVRKALDAVEKGDRVDLAVMLHLGHVIKFKNIDTTDMAALFRFFTETYDTTIVDQKTDDAYKCRAEDFGACWGAKTALDGYDIAFWTRKTGVVGHDPFGKDERDRAVRLREHAVVRSRDAPVEQRAEERLARVALVEEDQPLARARDGDVQLLELVGEHEMLARVKCGRLAIGERRHAYLSSAGAPGPVWRCRVLEEIINDDVREPARVTNESRGRRESLSRTLPWTRGLLPPKES